jgi:hypothetical protein
MAIRGILTSILTMFFLSFSNMILAQTQQLFTSQQFRLGERIIRISEPGQLADSINVWGDVGSSGRYLIPKGTTLSELISYSFGPRTLRDGQTELDWSKMRVEINVQEYDKENKRQTIEKFRIRFEEPFPVEMNKFELKNNHTVTLRVKRKPTFRDYLGIIAPVISSIATTIIIIDSVGGK